MNFIKIFSIKFKMMKNTKKISTISEIKDQILKNSKVKLNYEKLGYKGEILYNDENDKNIPILTDGAIFDICGMIYRYQLHIDDFLNYVLVNYQNIEFYDVINEKYYIHEKYLQNFRKIFFQK